MSNYIITVKGTYQTSEDTYERALYTRTSDESTTLKEILEWVKSLNGDDNTIRVHPDRKEETMTEIKFRTWLTEHECMAVQGDPDL